MSSAEAELYGMIEAVTRAMGLLSLAGELGFEDLSNVVHLGTDSSAAKSFVCRRGLGKMRHLQIRDLWLQKEVREGKCVVTKVPGEWNPADLEARLGENEYPCAAVIGVWCYGNEAGIRHCGNGLHRHVRMGSESFVKRGPDGDAQRCRQMVRFAAGPSK